jgi:hypothetical protein
VISLPDVTIVVVDCAAHGLTELALQDTLRLVDPGDVLVFSDQTIGGFANIACEHSSVDAAFETLWYEVPKHLKTTHYLHIEWDGWVLDDSLWDQRWLERDYVGAPWPWHNERHRVGNGGFSLRSRDLVQFLARYRDQLPIEVPEDDTLCRAYRPTLEREGFDWATLSEASQFSLEHGDLRPTFGFHDCRNWLRLLNQDAVRERLRAAPAYVRSKPGWREMELSCMGSVAG